MLCHTSPPPKPHSQSQSHNEMRIALALSLLRPNALLTSSPPPLPLSRIRKTLTSSNYAYSGLRSPPRRLRFATMASSYKPEEARVPPAVEIPVPPVTKVPLFSYQFRYWSFKYFTKIIRIFLEMVCQFKIALCQLSVTSDKDRNIRHARKAIEEAAGKGAQLVVLPVSSVSCNWHPPISGFMIAYLLLHCS